MQIPLNMRHAQAALIVASKMDIRYYLNSIFVEAAEDVRVVATDGHRMIVARSTRDQPGESVTVIVPRDAIEVALRLPFDRKKRERVAVLERMGVDDWFIRVGTMSIGFRPLEGNYPKYRSVIPAKCSGESANFNGRYVGDMYRVAEIFGGKRFPQFELLQNGEEGPALIRFAGDAVGVLMPLRTFESTGLAIAPSWVLEGAPVPTAETAPEPEVAAA